MKNFSYSLFKNIALLSSLGICASCNSNNTVNKHNQDNVKGDSSEDGDEENTPTFFKEEDKKNTGRINHAGKSRAEVGIEPGNKKSPSEKRKDEDDLDVVNLEKFKDFQSERVGKLNIKKETGKYDYLNLCNLCLDINDVDELYVYKNLVFDIRKWHTNLVCYDVEKEFKGPITVPGKVKIPLIKNGEISSFAMEFEVKYIGSQAFYNCENLSSVILPSTVCSIGYSAFDNCLSLQSVILPKKLHFISRYAFYGCTNLTSIELPSEVFEIGDYAFDNTGIKNVKILGENAFCSDAIENIFLEKGSRLKESDIQNALGKRWK